MWKETGGCRHSDKLSKKDMSISSLHRPRLLDLHLAVQIFKVLIPFVVQNSHRVFKVDQFLRQGV